MPTKKSEISEKLESKLQMEEDMTLKRRRSSRTNASQDIAVKPLAAKGGNPIDSLFAGPAVKSSLQKMKSSEPKEIVPKKKLTKKERKIKEQESDDRSIFAIISDTKAGKKVLADDPEDADQKSQRKRSTKAQAKALAAVESAFGRAESQVSKDASMAIEESKDVASAAAINRPYYKLDNGKPVLVMPTQVISSENAVKQIKQHRGETVARSRGKKISPLDNVQRDPTDRWSKEDTQKFYAAL